MGVSMSLRVASLMLDVAVHPIEMADLSGQVTSPLCLSETND